MTMPNQGQERYDLEIPEEGLDYDILDVAFNPTTRAFIKSNHLQSGMRVLDVGCGSGRMTHYLAECVGQEGRVVSIDNSQEQLTRAQLYCEQKGSKNVLFKLLSVYDLNILGETFDAIYCRFVLHHLHSPRQVINLFYEHLNKNGIYIAEEGIISAAFAYPPSNAWSFSRGQISSPDEEKDGHNRDGEFGMKLYYWMKKAGFTINDIKLIQPVLTTTEQKNQLLSGHEAYKKTALSQGKSLEEWEAEKQELVRLANDDLSIVGFYQSCQVCGIK